MYAQTDGTTKLYSLAIALGSPGLLLSYPLARLALEMREAYTHMPLPNIDSRVWFPVYLCRSKRLRWIVIGWEAFTCTRLEWKNTGKQRTRNREPFLCDVWLLDVWGNSVTNLQSENLYSFEPPKIQKIFSKQLNVKRYLLILFC